MKILILCPAEQSSGQTVVDLNKTVFGAGSLHSCTIVAVETPSCHLPPFLTNHVATTVKLPYWPYEEDHGWRSIDINEPGLQTLSRIAHSGFDRILIFGWALAPLAVVFPDHVPRLLLVEDWNIYGDVILSSRLTTKPVGPQPHEFGEFVAGFDNVVCLEPEVYNMARELYPAKAIACPVPINGWPKDMSDTWPVPFRTKAEYDVHTHDGLTNFLARQSNLHSNGLSSLRVELSSDFESYIEIADHMEQPVFQKASGETCVVLNLANQLRMPEFAVRNAMRSGDMTFLLEARSPNSLTENSIITPSGKVKPIEDVLSSQKDWAAFWKESVAEFRDVQKRNLSRWADILDGRPSSGGEFLFGGSGAGEQGGDVALIRAHSGAPLDADLTLALVQRLLELGNPEQALKYLHPTIRAAQIAGRRIQASQYLLYLLRRQNVFGSQKTHTALLDACAHLDHGGSEKNDHKDMYSVFHGSDSNVGLPLPSSIPGKPIFELGIRVDETGSKNFDGAFTLVFSQKAIRNDTRAIIQISGALKGADLEGNIVLAEVDGHPVEARISCRADGTFILTLNARIQADSDQVKEFFSTSVLLKKANGDAVVGRIDNIDIIPLKELVGTSLLSESSNVLAVLSMHDKWVGHGNHAIERNSKFFESAIPFRWLMDESDLNLVQIAPEMDLRKGAILAVVTLQISRLGLPPDQLTLRSRTGQQTAIALSSIGGAKAYVFDISHLFVTGHGLPNLEIISPITAEPSAHDSRPMSILLKSAVIVQLPSLSLFRQDQAVPVVGEQVVLCDTYEKYPESGAFEFERLAEFDIISPHILSPARILEIQGVADQNISSLSATVNGIPLDVVDIRTDGDSFRWQGRMSQTLPELSFGSSVKLSVKGNSSSSDRPVCVEKISFVPATAKKTEFELVEGATFWRAAPYYHSGKFMMGFWAGPGAKLMLDIPENAKSFWLAGDAAISKKAIKGITLSCFGSDIPTKAKLKADGRWRVVGKINESLGGGISVVEIGSPDETCGLIGLVRWVGYSTTSNIGKQN